MAKVWNIGNTTVRNPKRIEMGLCVMSEQNLFGRMEGADNEKAITKALMDAGVVDSSADGDSAAWLGRKWRNVMIKLGFLTDKKYRIDGKYVKIEDLDDDVNFQKNAYVLTPVGQKMVKATTQAEVSDIFLKQMIKHTLPNPIESTKNFNSNIRPFLLFLSVLEKVQENGKGLNQNEIAIFLQKIQPHTPTVANKIGEDIFQYREKRDQLSSKREKLQFDKDIFEKESIQMAVKPSTLRDYADTTVRYFTMTGLFEMRGSRIAIKEEKREFVQTILNLIKDDGIATEIEYLNNYYGDVKIIQNEDVAHRSEYQQLSEKAKKYNLEVVPLEDIPLEDIQVAKFELEEKLLLSAEEAFALAQQEDDEIEKIIEHISKIASGDRDYSRSVVDMPANLEWVVWRSFLSIDHIACPVKETRGFPVDAALTPRYPAPGGRADMVFEFDDHFLVVEVTLTTSSRQYVAECEPVRRHVAEERKGKPVYGLFIAPSLDNNFLHGLRNGYYRGDDLVHLHILPITLRDFEKIVQLHKNRKLLPQDIKELVLSGSDSSITDALEWKNHINQTLTDWITSKVS